MNTNRPDIAAVFATMNRCDVALACVKALAAQSVPLQSVVVADNCSSDGTVATLEALADLPFELTVLGMTENAGNAGGVRAAMDAAFAAGAEAVWILDDDSWPRPDALEKLIEIPPHDDEVIHPIQIDPRSGELTWPMQIHDKDIGWHTVHSLVEIEGRSNVVTRNNWTGSLVPRSVREKVGPVMGELFIRGEDEEYPWRFRQAGISQRAVIASVLDHPGPPSLQRISILGKTIYFEPGLADWKLHYKVRNMVWLKRRQSGGAKAILTAAAYAVAAVRFDGAARLPLVWRAARDGWRGKLGRWNKHL